MCRQTAKAYQAKSKSHRCSRRKAIATKPPRGAQSSSRSAFSNCHHPTELCYPKMRPIVTASHQLPSSSPYSEGCRPCARRRRKGSTSNANSRHSLAMPNWSNPIVVCALLILSSCACVSCAADPRVQQQQRRYSDQNARAAHLLSGNHTRNAAVLVSSSRYWHNYRHVSNVLSVYNLLKTGGQFTDDNIILMIQ